MMADTVRRDPSTMQDFPLTIAAILRHGERVYANSECVTWTERRRAPRDLRRGRRQRGAARARVSRTSASATATGSARSAGTPGAPRGVPRGPVDGRGAAHAEHPAVPRAAHVRRQPRARTRSSSSTTRSIPVLAKVAARAHDVSSASSWSATATRRRSRRSHRTPRSCGTTSCSPAEPAEFDWPEIDERQAAAMCYTSGTTGNPKGVAYSHRSSYLHSLAATHAGRAGPVGARTHPDDRSDVPRQRVGHPVRGVHVRRVARDARPVPAGRAAHAHGEGGGASRSRARCRRSGPTSCATARSTRSTCRRCA